MAPLGLACGTGMEGFLERWRLGGGLHRRFAMAPPVHSWGVADSGTASGADGRGRLGCSCCGRDLECFTSRTTPGGFTARLGATLGGFWELFLVAMLPCFMLPPCRSFYDARR